MEKCFNPDCENLLIHTEGRRKKKYCSVKCKNKINSKKFFLKPTNQKTKRLPLDEYNKYQNIISQIKKNQGDVLQFLENLHKNTLNNIKPNKSFSKEVYDFEENNIEIKKHPLWKQGDPKENSMAFIMKYNCNNYEELQKLIDNK